MNHEPAPQLVFPLAAAPADAAVIGSKAANLARLAGIGLPVPPGFCVSARAYDEHLRSEGLTALLHQTLEAAATASAADRRTLLAKLRTNVVEAPVSDSLTRHVEEAYRGLGAGRVAVRSSATMEDLAGHSFAGQYDTFLGVSGPADVLTAVKKCWASLWSERAFDYREKNGFDHRGARMAVVVQRLVAADVSGVLFTADPVSGRTDRLVIEAAYGLGEALVSGKVTPDRVVLAKDGLRVLEQTVGEKAVEVVAAEGGSQEQPVEPERAKRACLPEGTARRLGELALRAETAFGSPQDVEWAVSGGEIFVLQSRPITTLTRPRTFEDRQVWSNLNAGEVVPDVVTPMTWSLIASLIEEIFGSIMARLGFDLGGHPLVGLVAGRVYFNLNTFVGIMRRSPGFRDFDPIEAFGGKPGSGLAVPPEDVPDLDFRWGRFLTGLPGFVLWFLSHSTWRGLFFAAAMRRRAGSLAAGDLTILPEADLARRMQALVDRTAVDINETIAFGGIGGMYLTRLVTICRKWLGDPDGSLAYRLLAGMGNMDSAEAGLALWRLAALAHAHADVERALLEGDDFRATREVLAGVRGGPECLAAWEAFMDRHGHHARGEIELFNARWRETPDSVLDTLRGHLRAVGTIDPLANHRRSGQERVRLTGECRRRLRNPLKRLAFDFVLANAQRGCKVRENIKSEAVRWLALGRTLLRELGDRLCRRGVLESADDVFFLRQQELEPARSGAAGFDVRAAVARRRAEYERNLTLNPPSLVVGRFDPARHAAEPAAAGSQVLNGVAVSPGVATGPARVVLRSDTDEQVLPGEVLVAPFTDPGWTPYFLRAAAIVMDQGGLLSHGSVIAREYGIPAVANVGPATRTVRTGQLLRVDGNRGEVTVIDA